MSNGEVCCILGICCPPASAAQLQALSHEVQKQRPHLTADEATAIAQRILDSHESFADVAGYLPPPPTVG